MTLDVRTLFVAVAVACLANILAISAVWLANRRVPGVGMWTLGAVLTGLSLQLFLLRAGLDHRLVTHALPILLKVAAILAFMAGALVFRGKPAGWGWLLALGGMVLGPVFWFLFAEDDQAARIRIFSGWAAVIYLVSAVIMAMERRSGLRFSSRLVAGGFGIAGAGMLLRYLIWSGDSPRPLVSGTDPENVVLALMALVTCSFLVFGMLFVVNQHHIREAAFRIREQQRMEHRLQEVKLEVEKERALKHREMLLRELHDGIGGITATLASLASLGRVESTGQMMEIFSCFEEMALKGSKEVRGLMASVEHDVFRWSDWLDELEGYVRKVMKMAGMEFRWEVTGMVPQGIITDPLAASSLMKVAFEAVHNTVRHSGAESAAIRIRFADGKISIILRDDGRGVCGGDTGGKGIHNMKVRMEELGGSVSISVADGTTVGICCPLVPGGELSSAETVLPDGVAGAA